MTVAIQGYICQLPGGMAVSLFGPLTPVGLRSRVSLTGV